jgi:hypothetical protein
MCALCGILGSDDHWSHALPRDGVYTRNTDRLARRTEAALRARVVNAALTHLRLNLGDWQGRTYVLRNATGKTVLFDAIGHLWPEAEALSGKTLDPLDPVWLDHIEAQLVPEALK